MSIEICLLFLSIQIAVQTRSHPSKAPISKIDESFNVKKVLLEQWQQHRLGTVYVMYLRSSSIFCRGARVDKSNWASQRFIWSTWGEETIPQSYELYRFKILFWKFNESLHVYEYWKNGIEWSSAVIRWHQRCKSQFNALWFVIKMNWTFTMIFIDSLKSFYESKWTFLKSIEIF